MTFRAVFSDCLWKFLTFLGKTISELVNSFGNWHIVFFKFITFVLNIWANIGKHLSFIAVLGWHVCRFNINSKQCLQEKLFAWDSVIPQLSIKPNCPNLYPAVHSMWSDLQEHKISYMCVHYLKWMFIYAIELFPLVLHKHCMEIDWLMFSIIFRIIIIILYLTKL